MNNKHASRSWFLVAAIAFLFGSAPLRAASEGALDDALVERLTNLPHGLAHQEGVVVRAKHVESVEFTRTGVASRFSFLRGRAIVPEALSLQLQNKSAEWAVGTIQLKKPTDVARYNSLVLWVRAANPGVRLRVGAKNKKWTSARATMPLTDAFPAEGLPSRRPVLVVVPYSSIVSASPIDFRNLHQIGIEFQNGEADVLGVAFVQQDPVVRGVMIVSGEAPVAAAPRPRVKNASLAVAKKAEVAAAPVKKRAAIVAAAPAPRVIPDIPVVEPVSEFRSAATSGTDASAGLGQFGRVIAVLIWLCALVLAIRLFMLHREKMLLSN